MKPNWKDAPDFARYLAMARDAEVDRLKAALMEIAIDNECDCDDGTCQKCICRDAVEGKG